MKQQLQERTKFNSTWKMLCNFLQIEFLFSFDEEFSSLVFLIFIPFVFLVSYKSVWLFTASKCPFEHNKKKYKSKEKKTHKTISRVHESKVSWQNNFLWLSTCVWWKMAKGFSLTEHVIRNQWNDWVINNFQMLCLFLLGSQNIKRTKVV